MSWRLQRLELLASDEPYSFVGGPFGSKLTTRDYVEDGVPVIRGSNMNNGRYLDLSEFAYVSESKVREDLSSNLAKPLDLVFTQRGTLGQVAIIPKDGVSDRYVVSQSQMKLTVDSMKVERLFLYYFFSSRETKERLASYASSSGVPHINLTVLRNFEVPVPPLALQQQIASILSAYDELIENNRRRIHLLEQSARLLYKEWFVDLRFPGHEHVKIKDGVPEGWALRPLSAVVKKLGSGATPRGGAAIYQSDGIALFRSQNVYDYRFDDAGLAYIDDEEAEKLESVAVEAFDILLNITGASVARCCIAPRRYLPARVNQHVMIVRLDTDQCGVQYAMHCINSHEQKQSLLSIARAGGATREALTKADVENVTILIPPASLREHFEELAGNIFKQKELLEAQIAKLAAARNLLLPRLMNGEVEL